MFDKNIFKYHGNINYEDNLPVYNTSTWFYDIFTFNRVKLTNCSSKYITVSEETVPTNVYDAHNNNPVCNPVHNPYRKPQQKVHIHTISNNHPIHHQLDPVNFPHLIVKSLGCRNLCDQMNLFTH
jgi:hypothetical protein